MTADNWDATWTVSDAIHAEEVAMTFDGFDEPGQLLSKLAVHPGYCVDCLSQLYGGRPRLLVDTSARLKSAAAKLIAAIAASTRAPS